MALCLTGFLSAFAGAASNPDALEARFAQAASAASPAAPAAPAAVKSDTVKPAKTSKAKKSKAVKDSTKAANAAVEDSLKAAAADSAKAAIAKAAADSLRQDSARAAAAMPVPVATPDSAKQFLPDSAKTIATADSGAEADSSQVKAKKKRKRVVRETTVNTIDDLKGTYRSPKKALFMSMLVPGLGQAYVGHTWGNYTRGAVYFLTDIALAYGWHYYVVDRQNAQIDKYKTFADVNWHQEKYENVIAKDPTKAEARNQHRENYCETVQDRSTTKGNSLFLGCATPTSADYESFQSEYKDLAWGSDSVAHRRSEFPNPHNFYELIGKENEFITGWDDANNIFLGDSAYYAMGPDGNPAKDNLNRLILATTPFQQKYIGMRAQANDYARMQAYFLGGMVVNHIVSAIDAALAAHYHNKALYQTETNWWDRVRLDSQLAWNGFAPTPMLTAYITF
ncbi:MAG: hypothetical protein JWP91_1769 [Fibrobacteres bacterium]|nr:hypothetical protein [Fibrobacterota bacterium]